MRPWFDAAAGQARPVHPRARGVGPERGDQRRRPLGGLRRRPGASGEPIPTTQLDRPPRAARGRGAGAGHMRGLRGIPAMRNNPTGAMGLRDYLGGRWTSRLGLPIINLPGCPCSPTTSPRRCSTWRCTSPAPGRCSSSTSRDGPRWLFGAPCSRAAAGPASPSRASSPATPATPRLPGQAGLQGAGGMCNVPIRGWTGGVGGCPNVGGICIGLHDARLPGQVHAVHGRPTRSACSRLSGARFTYGPVLRQLRRRAIAALYDREPDWRGPGGACPGL